MKQYDGFTHIIPQKGKRAVFFRVLPDKKELQTVNTSEVREVKWNKFRTNVRITTQNSVYCLSFKPL